MFMLYWIGDPEELKKQLKEPDFPSIVVRKGQILRAGSLEKLEFLTKEGERDTKKGIAELEAKGLITTSRYGDMQLTEKGEFKLGYVRGRIRLCPAEKVRLSEKSSQEREEEEEKARERLIKERKAWQER